VEEIYDVERKVGFIYLQNIKPSPFDGTKKLYWRRV